MGVARYVQHSTSAQSLSSQYDIKKSNRTQSCSPAKRESYSRFIWAREAVQTVFHIIFRTPFYRDVVYSNQKIVSTYYSTHIGRAAGNNSNDCHTVRSRMHNNSNSPIVIAFCDSIRPLRKKKSLFQTCDVLDAMQWRNSFIGS